MARVKAHLAQVSRLRAGGGAGTLLKTGEISVDTAAHRVYKNGREVELKNKEYELLVFFMMNKGLLFNADGTPTARTGKILAATPMRKFGEIDDLIGCLLWLADDGASGFVTGTVIPVDGGFSAYSGV